MSENKNQLHSELLSTLADQGIVTANGEPTDKGSIVVEGKGKASSSNGTSTSAKRKSRKSKKSNKPAVDPAQPTDDLIHLKQQVVVSINDQVKAGVHLHHVPLPNGEEYDRSPREGDDSESDYDSSSDHEAHQQHDGNQAHMPPQDEGEAEPSGLSIREAARKVKEELQRKASNQIPSNLTQKLDNVSHRLDDLKMREQKLVHRQKTLSQEALGSHKKADPSIFSIFVKIFAFAQVLPLVVRCVFNTVLLYVISKALDTYAAAISRLQNMFDKWLLPYTPNFVMGFFQFFTRFFHNVNSYAINFIASKKSETEDYTRFVDDKMRSFGHDLVRDFRIVEESVQNYSPKVFQFRENLTMFVVILVRYSLCVTVPAFNIIQNLCQEFVSKRKVPVA